MDTRFACQHRTTKMFLANTPSLGLGYKETADETEAAHWPTMTQATLELLELGEFADAWDAVPVQREMFSARHNAGKSEGEAA